MKHACYAAMTETKQICWLSQRRRTHTAHSACPIWGLQARLCEGSPIAPPSQVSQSIPCSCMHPFIAFHKESCAGQHTQTSPSICKHVLNIWNCLQGRAALQAEWQRVRANQPMDKLAFGKTMAPEPSQSQQNSVPHWREALQNAQTQLEHQHNWWVNCRCNILHIHGCASNGHSTEDTCCIHAC